MLFKICSRTSYTWETVLELTPREIVAILNQIAKIEILENGKTISASGGNGEEYINKQLALMKARENSDDDDENDNSSEEFEALLIEKGLAKPCPT